MMRIVAVIASYRRGKILQDVIDCLKPQVYQVIVVGSSVGIDGDNGCGDEWDIAYNSCVDYVDCKNVPLGVKWQEGMNHARLFHPDAVLICGSDDLIVPAWGSVASDILSDYRQDSRYDIVGLNRWYVLNAPTNQMISCSYKTRRDPIGAGRIIRKELLDKCGWQIFPRVSGIGCDGYSFEILKKHCTGRICEMQHMLVSVKGTWPCLDTWDQMVNAQSLNVEFVSAEDTVKFLKGNFPKIDFRKYAV